MLLGIRWGSLRAKIIAWSFVPTAIILGAVAWVTFNAYQQVTADLVIERDQELTRLWTGEFAAGLTEYTGLLTEYTGLLADLASTTIRESDPTAQRDALRRVRSRLEAFDAGVLVLDNHGTVVAAEPERPDALGQNWADRSYFRQMLRSPKPVFSNVVADGPQGTQAIVVAVPIRGDQGQFLGILAGLFRLGATTFSPFYGDIERLGIGEGDSAYLVDGAGRVIYHSDPSRIGEDFSTQATVQRVSSGQLGALRTRDSDGRDIIASFAPVPGTPWGLVSEEMWATLTDGSRSYQRFLLLLLALGLLVPALVVAVGVTRLTRPITELIGAAQEVAGGNFGQMISAPTGDEIEELAEQFNLMAAQLRESYAHLERRVADRAKELAALNAIAAVVSGSLNLEEVLNAALDKTLEVMEIEAGGIYLLEEEAGVLTVAAQRGFSPTFVAGIDRLKVGEGFSGRVAQSGELLFVRDVSADPRLTRAVAKEEGLRSLASVPLSSRGRVLGTLFAVTHGYREFTDQDIQLLTSIGLQIGVAIQNAHLFDAERRRREEAILLAEMAKLISGTLDLDEVLHLTAQYAVDVFDVHCCCIFVHDERKGCLRPAARIGFDDQAVAAMAGVEFCPSDLMRQTVFEELQPLIIEDVPSEPILSPPGLPVELQSALVVPIEVGGRMLGAMQLSTRRPRRRCFTAEEGELALAMANQAAMTIDNARLFEAEQRRAEQFRVISEVGRRITSILPVDELLMQMTRLIKNAFDYHGVGIGLIEGDELVFQTGAGSFWDDPQFQPLSLGLGQQGITGWVAGTGEPLLVPDVSQEPRYYLPPFPQARKTRSELAVPMKVKGTVIGVLDVESDRLDAFDESDLVVLQSLASQAAIAIENARLYEQAQQLAVVEERSRLARDLHDSVTQTLFSASLIAETLPVFWESNPERGRELLGEIRRLSRGALAEMRTLLLELRPTALVEASLGDLLGQLGEAVTGRTGVPVTVTVEGEGELPSDVHVALYRIAQEALNNVIKHARASQVAVRLYCVSPLSPLQAGRKESGDAELCISDDGCGFDPDGIPPGRLGLSIMRERAKSIGATLGIESRPGWGTQIVAVWNRDE